MPSPERPLAVVLGQEPILSLLVLAGVDVDGDEVPHMSSEEHLGLRPVSVLVRSIPVGQHGSAELVVVERASRAQGGSDHPLRGLDSELRTCVFMEVVCVVEPVFDAPGLQEGSQLTGHHSKSLVPCSGSGNQL